MASCVTGPFTRVIVSNGGVFPRWEVFVWDSRARDLEAPRLLLPPTLGRRVMAFYMSKALGGGFR